MREALKTLDCSVFIKGQVKKGDKMKNYNELPLMKNQFGIETYALYKAGVITEEQLIKLNDMPTCYECIDECFKTIDQVFKEG